MDTWYTRRTRGCMITRGMNYEPVIKRDPPGRKLCLILPFGYLS